jgi:hypothetical protein
MRSCIPRHWDGLILMFIHNSYNKVSSVGDPYHVFGPPGSASGFVSHKYGSGSFHRQARMARKTCFVTSLRLFIFYDVNVPVFRIRIWIRRIHMFLGIPDPHPDPLVRGTDPRIRIWIHIEMSRIHSTETESK